MVVNIPDNTGKDRDTRIFIDKALRDNQYKLSELRNLLLLCQASDASQRPSLQQVLMACEAAVSNGVGESDDEIQEAVQKAIFDANVVALTSG
jgi:DNA-binding transcriptional MerR regulator